MHIENQSQANNKTQERDAAIQIITDNNTSVSVFRESLISAAWLIGGFLAFLHYAAPLQASF